MPTDPDDLLEQREFFAIAADLAAARRIDDGETIEQLIDELEIVKMHTRSARVRRECVRLIDSAQDAVAVRA